MNRLSSDNLYHFKSKINRIHDILKNGFSHRMWGESIPYLKSEQQNFIVCFCDIKPDDAGYHRKCYGNNALVLSKEWGIKNGVSPVRYVLESSPGVSKEYVRAKNYFRGVKEDAKGDNDALIQMYSIISVLFDERKISSDSVEKDVYNNPALIKEMEKAEQEFMEIFDALNNNPKASKDLSKFLRSLMNRIFFLHNELENRDAFMRAYMEDFKHPTGGIFKDKVLYDEREWRSIKFANIGDYDAAIQSSTLPDSYNLKFGDDDLLAILVEDQNSYDQMEQFILNETLLVDKNITIGKIHLIDNFTEQALI